MIQVHGVHKRFGNNHVLRGVTVDVHDHETLTIIGGSGTGKSVLIKHMVGLLKPDRGRITVDGQETTSLPEKKLLEVQKKFGYLFQGAALFDSLTVSENVAFGLRNLTDLNEREIRERVTERLAMVGLEDVEHLKPAELSGGMKKRVALARAIAANPKYIMYDEPTTGLDPIMADIINDLILHLQKKLGVTSVAVTHDMKSAYKISNRIAMLYEGTIIGAGTPEEIKTTHNEFIKQFVTGSGKGPIKMKVREY
ncbi:MAG: ATP-binding cassette domain-containing protein [Elusimicrobia bacterium]|nr:ATP-binding cassette domain-containing protein [Elusimicrobiota bacterium]MBD3412008.1 ATP-binding cassette domain-containing protein [Elusimicrobiota bacterium]